LADDSNKIAEAINVGKHAIKQLTECLCILNAAAPNYLLHLPTMQDVEREELQEGLRIVYDDFKKALECCSEIRDIFLKQELYNVERKP
jgi:hypothetical protein